MAGRWHRGSFFEYERRYAAELNVDDRKDHVFHTSFETLKKQPLDTIKAMGAFLSLERTEEFYQRVVEQTSFENVKAVRDAQYK